MRAFDARLAGFAAALALVLSAAAGAYGDIVWTPEGGWRRSSPTPEVRGADRFDKAYALYVNGRYGKAADILKDIVKEGAPELREEASLLLAESLLGARNYRAAYEQFEKFIEAYPSSRWVDRATEGEIEIARALLAGKRVKFAGLRIFRSYGLGERIVDRITTSRPFSDYARRAQLLLAESYYTRQLYLEAASAYRQYIEFFPESAQVPQAFLGVAKSYLNDARGPRYSPLPYFRALSALQTLMRQYPGVPEARTAAALAQVAEGKMAEHYYVVGRWYLERRRLDSALVYFDKVVTEFPETTWAERSGHYVGALTARPRG